MSKKDGSTYTGFSDDLKRRLVQHNKGENISTKHKTPFQLVYYEAYRTRADALAREKSLKQHAGSMTALKRRLPTSLA